uniref:DNA 5'-3' helicase n=1 Tax=Agarophyton chilense TaxID=2510777 RepID=A0A222FZE4_AGACH|nr:replicative DNA helicase [Agarophyton chilense]
MYSIILDSTLPQNYIAEEILLGTILIYPTVFPQVMPFLKSDSFFVESHKLIYTSLVTLHKAEKIDILQLFYFLNDSEILYDIGGIFKIIELMRQSHVFMPSINTYVYVQELMKLINNSYIKRLVIQYGHNVIKLANIHELPSYQLYNKVSEYLESTVYKIPKQNLMTFSDLLSDLLVQLKYENLNLTTSSLNQTMLLSGFQQLDQFIQGFQGGDLIVIAGRPSVGKTSFVINIISNIISTISLRLCFFSLEMSKIQIVSKFVAISSGVSTQNITFSKLTLDEWYSLNKICSNLMQYDIYINDTPNMSVDYIEYTSKLLHQDTGSIQLIVIDYLQLVQLEGFTNHTRTQELGYITRKLKLLAQYLDIPVIILSQLNRSIETRVNKLPLLSDLRESGCIVNHSHLNLNFFNKFHSHSFNNFRNIIHNNLIKFSAIKSLFNFSIHALYFQFSIQYSFSLCFFFCVLSLTHNHKLYLKKGWHKFSHYLENSICIMNYSFNFDLYILEYIYMPRSMYYDYVSVFDMKEPNYMMLLLNNFIIHNSIEQDADIVIILSKFDRDISSTNVIDISLCKNRNGATGLCTLLFTPVINKFSDIEV